MRRLAILGVGFVLGFAVLYGAVLRPISSSDTYQVFGEMLSRADTQDRVVALALDDGPSPRHTADVLQILAEQNATATFFF